MKQRISETSYVHILGIKPTGLDIANLRRKEIHKSMPYQERVSSSTRQNSILSAAISANRSLLYRV